MKNTIYLTSLLFLLTIISCKQDKSSTNSVSDSVTSNESEIEQILSDPVLSNDWKKEIKLDGTKKWIANQETNDGVRNMLNILENSEVGPEMDFIALATKLKSEINVVIKKCSMKGDSHENLHVFLMPLIEKVSALQEKENNIEKNKALIASIYYNLEAYNTYFK